MSKGIRWIAPIPSSKQVTVLTLVSEPHEQIYYNHEGQLLETSIGNIVLKIEDQLYTPPVHLGLLNGIYRQSLIADNKLKEKVLTVKDMEQAQAIYGCNAVRGLYELKVEG